MFRRIDFAMMTLAITWAVVGLVGFTDLGIA